MRSRVFPLAGMVLLVLAGCTGVTANSVQLTANPTPAVEQAAPGTATPALTESQGNLASNGATGTEPAMNTTPNSDPGSGSGARSTPLPGSAGGETPASDQWQLYENEQFGFSIRYPPHLVVDETEKTPQPGRLAQIRFQDRALANSPTARLQPPRFAISIFQNEQMLPLDDWINRSGSVPGVGFESREVTIDGKAGLRVTTDLTLAPGEFVYVPKGALIFQFTLLDPASEEMLASVRFK